MKKKKTINISKLKLKADAIFSKWIRKRDSGKCYTCSKQDEEKFMQCGHYVPRDVIELRYNEVNCHCQCVACNVFKKGNYVIYSQKLIEEFGIKKVKELSKIYENRHADVKKYSRDFYENIIEKYGNNI